MKKILINIILIFLSFCLKAQTYPLIQNIASGSTKLTIPNYGALYGGMIPLSFSDTAAANTALTYGKNYAGFLIFTTTERSLWYRDITGSRWVMVLPSGSPLSPSAWVYNGNNLASYPDSAVLGTTSNTDWFLISNNQKFLKLNKGGIQANSGSVVNLGVNMSTGDLSFGSSSSTPTWQQTLTAGSTLTGTNTVENTTFPFLWNWTGLTQNGLVLAASTTAAISGQTLFSVGLSGANAAAGRTTYAAQIQNTHTGTSSTNYGLFLSASGASSANYALVTNNGDVLLNQTSGTTTFGNAGALSGIFNVSGSGSGTITFQPQSAAGTYNFNWPTTAGTSGYLLTSGGGGSSAMTWTAPGANTALSNLASVAINTSLLPGTDNSIDLGSTTKTWRNEYLSGSIAIGSTSTTFDVDVRKTVNGSIGFGVQNASGGTSAAAVFQLGRSYGADFYVSHYYAGDGNTVYTPLSYNIINAVGSTGGMFFNNIASASMGFLTANTTRMTILGGGNIGIGDATPASLFTVGSGDKFQVDGNGNIVKLNNVTTSFPSSNSSGVLTNNGSGTLSWSVPYWALTGTNTLTGNTIVNIDRTGSGPFRFSIEDGTANVLLDVDLNNNIYGLGDLNKYAGKGFIKFDVGTEKAYLMSGAIFGGSAGDAVTIADPSTGELTVAPNLAFNFMKENTMIYAKNGRLWAEDADKNLTQISPHNDKGEWIYKSTDKNGVTTEINMIRLAELLEKVTGEKLIYRTKN